MKESSAADELKTLEGFKNTRSEWFLKDEKEKKKREARDNVFYQKKNQKLLLKEIMFNEGDKEDKSSSSSEEGIDETERLERIRAEIDKEKQLKRKRREEKDDDDDVYVPSPDHDQDTPTPPSSGGRKKTSARKRVVSPKAARRKLTIKLNPKRASKPKPSTPPKQPAPPELSPIQSPPHQSLPHLSPPHQSPTLEQPVITSQHIIQTTPSFQPHVQTTPGSSDFKDFPHVPKNIGLEDIGDFGFANDEQVKKLEKKVEEVLVENKKLLDREKKLEKRVKTVEADNLSLLKRVDFVQTGIDIMKVRITELEEEKAQRDRQNKYFKLKNKELEVANAKKEHKIYMMNKVLENLLGKYAVIDAEMKNKGKCVEGVSDVTERAIIPSIGSESPI
ncbi:hypothetical protein Hanom_Chr04g00348861 [Helianthus anomalus]